MLDLQTLIFKFGLPGLPLSFIIVFQLLPDEKIPDITLLTLALSLLVGYIVQQMWFFIFEISSWSYNNKKRKVLVWLKDDLISNKKNALLRKKWNINENNLSGDKLYSIWESIVYRSDETKLAIDKLRGFWNYFHSNMAIFIGLLLGILAYFIFNVDWSPWVPGGFAICAIVLFSKALQSKRIVDELERNWAEEFVNKEVKKIGK